MPRRQLGIAAQSNAAASPERAHATSRPDRSVALMATPPVLKRKAAPRSARRAPVSACRSLAGCSTDAVGNSLVWLWIDGGERALGRAGVYERRCDATPRPSTHSIPTS